MLSILSFILICLFLLRGFPSQYHSWLSTIPLSFLIIHFLISSIITSHYGRASKLQLLSSSPPAKTYKLFFSVKGFFWGLKVQQMLIFVYIKAESDSLHHFALTFLCSLELCSDFTLFIYDNLLTKPVSLVVTFLFQYLSSFIFLIIFSFDLDYQVNEWWKLETYLFGPPL